MEVHAIHDRNRHLYKAEMDDFFLQRYHIYSQQKRWRPASSTGLAVDGFDTVQATYLVGLVDGRVIAGARLIPTTEPHLLSEVFPELCDIEPPPHDPAIAEWTSGFIVPEFRERARVNLKARFCATVMEYCLEQGVALIGGMQDVYWLPLWKRFRWSARAIGGPTLVDGEWCVPAFVEVSREALAGAWRFARLERSILVQKGPARNFVPPKGFHEEAA